VPAAPSNVARFVPAIPGYIYALSDKDLYINLFISNEAEFNIGKISVKVVQEANFPWDGKVNITMSPGKPAKFRVKIRIPGWAQNVAIPGDLYKFDDKVNEPFSISCKR
jgi:DUF1680 family protein